MGRPRTWLMREIMNAIFYVLRSGCGWRMIPKCFPPATTVYGWFLCFRREGIFERELARLMHDGRFSGLAAMA